MVKGSLPTQMRAQGLLILIHADTGKLTIRGNTECYVLEAHECWRLANLLIPHYNAIVNNGSNKFQAAQWQQLEMLHAPKELLNGHFPDRPITYNKDGSRRKPRLRPTHCKNGHSLLVLENVYTNPRNGKRNCKLCMLISTRRHEQKRKVKRLEARVARDKRLLEEATKAGVT